MAHFAAAGGSLHIMRHLHSLGVSSTLPDRFGDTPLRCAVAFGQADMVYYLWIRVGNEVGNMPWDWLTLAIRFEHGGFARELLDVRRSILLDRHPIHAEVVVILGELPRRL
jgi:ankyrin repeat protein